jgi:hypothetical protein
MESGGFEAHGLEKIIQSVDDAVVESVELRETLLL